MPKYLIFLLLVLSVSLSFAQESTEVPVEQTEEAVIPTAEVTAEVTAESTEIFVATEEASTAAPTTAAPVTAPEPALSLWSSDSFQRQISPEWILPSGWAGNGTSLDIESPNSAFFSNETFS